MYDTALELLDAADRRPRFGRSASKLINFGQPPTPTSITLAVSSSSVIKEGDSFYDEKENVLYLHPNDFEKLKGSIGSDQKFSIGIGSPPKP